jgi:hypothetical protein
VAGFVLCAIMVVGFSFIDMVSNKQGQKGRTIENTSTPALEQAKLQAQQNWQEFVQAFANRRPGDVFFVKAPFSEGGPVEHMWVNVQSMSDQGMAGTLDSRLPTAAAGCSMDRAMDKATDRAMGKEVKAAISLAVSRALRASLVKEASRGRETAIRGKEPAV